MKHSGANTMKHSKTHMLTEKDAVEKTAGSCVDAKRVGSEFEMCSDNSFLFLFQLGLLFRG
jgi:hypothetical protein